MKPLRSTAISPWRTRKSAPSRSPSSAPRKRKPISPRRWLSPRDSGVNVFYFILGFAKLMLGKDEEALAWLGKSVEANRSSPLAIFTYAAAVALVGRIEEA